MLFKVVITKHHGELESFCSSNPLLVSLWAICRVQLIGYDSDELDFYKYNSVWYKGRRLNYVLVTKLKNSEDDSRKVFRYVNESWAF